MTERKSDQCRQNKYEEGCRLTHAGKLQEAVRAFSAAIDCNTGWAEAYFRRGVCYYLLGNCRLAAHDMDAATLLGCRDAQLWSRFDIQQFDDSDEK
jgi:tetratricopeptide (TPR) repeat protein